MYDAASCTSELKVLLRCSRRKTRRTNGTYSNVAFANLYDGTTPLDQLHDESLRDGITGREALPDYLCRMLHQPLRLCVAVLGHAWVPGIGRRAIAIPPSVRFPGDQ